MMAWLLDTNILSEIRRLKPEPRVLTFIAARPLDELYISAVTLAELRFGIEQRLDAGGRTSTSLSLPRATGVYLVECSSKDCDNAEFGDTPEEATRLWNFANPDWDGNVPVR